MFKITMLAVLLGFGCGDNGRTFGNDPDAQRRPDAPAPPIDAPPDARPDAPPDAPPAPVSIVPNGDFEAGAMAPWICNGNASCSVINTDYHGGSYSGSAMNLPNDYSGFRINVLPLVCPTDLTCATGATLLGKTLRFHGFIKPVGAATAIRLVLRWSCPSQSMGSYEWLQNINAPVADTWNELSRDFLLPNCNYEGTSNNLYLYTGTAGATEIRIDDLTIIDVTPP